MRALLLILLLLLIPVAGYPLEVPPLSSRVTDLAGMLSATTRQQLETELAAFEQSQSTQIVILTVPSLEGEPVEQFGIKVAEAWRIGRKGINSGVILILSRREHKIRIEVGRGLESRLTDLVSGRIIRNEMAPLLKRGDSDGGIAAGVYAVMAAVKGEYAAAPPQKSEHDEQSALPLFSFFIVALVICVYLGAISRYLSGVGGAILMLFGIGLSPTSVSFVVSAALALVGFVIGFLVPTLFSSGGRGGSGGGPWLGGGFGGGSGGDGGFSGGGGDFGGGGASGDW